MNAMFGNHPVLGPGFSGLRAWVWLVLLVLVSMAIGVAVTFFNPVTFAIGVAAIIAAVTFLWACVAFPVATLCFVVLCQIIVPIYIRLPMKIPPGLLMLALLIALTAAQRMVNPVPTRYGKYHNLIATVLIVYNVAMLLTLPSAYASSGSLFFYIKAVFIPTSLFFVFLAIAREPRHVEYVLNTITFGAVLCAALGILEYVTKNNLLADLFAPEVSIDEDFFLWFLANADESQDGFATGSVYRVYSFFTQPLEYAAFMIMAFPFPALKFVTARTGMVRAVYGLATLAIFAGFIVAFSRGPTLALGLVILFMGIFEKRVRPWIFAGACTIGVFLIVYWPLIVEKLSDRITNTENVTLRLSLWENGLKIFLENPLRGIGYGSYPNYHVQSIRDNQIGPMYEYTWPHIERVTTVENIFVTLAAETGLLGLSAMAFLLATSFYVFGKLVNRFRDGEIRILSLAAISGCLSYLLSGMTVSNLTLYTVTCLFFGVYLAALTVLARNLPD